MKPWIGLRPEDLSDEQRDALTRDPALAGAHAEALDLGTRLGALDAPVAPPTAEQVLARLRTPPRRTRWAPWVGGLAVAAAALLVLRPGGEPTPGQRDRGAAPALPPGLEAVAESSSGVLRGVSDGAAVGADERVIFRVTAPAAGELRLDQAGTGPLYPPPGDHWQVPAGTHAPGGQAPLAWRPDTLGPDRETRIVATWCPSTGGTCLESVMLLRWDPATR